MKLKDSGVGLMIVTIMEGLKKDIIKLLEQEDNEDRLKEIQDILNR